MKITKRYWKSFPKFLVLQNLGLMRRVMSFKLMIPFFKIDIKKIIF